MERIHIILIVLFASQVPEHEHLTVVDERGTVIAEIDGGSTCVVIDANVDQRLREPDAHLRMSHNHPRSASLSSDDLEQLEKSGVDVILAVGADGSRYEARRGSRFGASPLAWEYAFAYEEALRLVARAGRMNIVIHGDEVPHLIAVALHKARIIEYRFDLSPGRRQRQELARTVVGPITEAVASHLEHAIAGRAAGLHERR